MLKIIKKGKNMKYNNLFIHRCSECKTKFIYDIKKDTEINGLLDTRRVIQCPNCDNYDLIEGSFGIYDKKYKKYNLAEKIGD